MIQKSSPDEILVKWKTLLSENWRVEQEFTEMADELAEALGEAIRQRDAAQDNLETERANHLRTIVDAVGGPAWW